MTAAAHARDTEYILVVDGDEDTREAVGELVGSCDRPVHTVKHADAAKRWLVEGQRLCALVIACGPRDCDDVREFVAELRKQKTCERALVIVLSTISSLEAFDAGTVVLQKPFDGEKLIELVCGHC